MEETTAERLDLNAIRNTLLDASTTTTATNSAFKTKEARTLRKRQYINGCQITRHTLMEFLNTGRMCGRRGSYFRFGLGGKK